MLFKMSVSKYVLNRENFKKLEKLLLDVIYTFTSYRELIKKWNINRAKKNSLESCYKGYQK